MKVKAVKQGHSATVTVTLDKRDMNNLMRVLAVFESLIAAADDELPAGLAVAMPPAKIKPRSDGYRVVP